MSECIFCKIISGDIPSYTIYEDDDFKVILDAFPSGEGHTLVIPKKHVANVYEIDDDLMGKAHVLAKRAAAAVQTHLNCDGVNILQNNGEAAGQTVFHYHIHILPRFASDDLAMNWKTQCVDPADFEQTKLALKKLI